MRGPQTTDLRRSIACGYTAFLGCRIFVAADQRSSFAQLRKFYDVRERRATFGSPPTRLLSNPGLAGSESQSRLAKATLVLVGFSQRHSETRGECRAARGLAAKSAHRPETRPRFRCACWLHRPTDTRGGPARREEDPGLVCLRRAGSLNVVMNVGTANPLKLYSSEVPARSDMLIYTSYAAPSRRYSHAPAHFKNILAGL